MSEPVRCLCGGEASPLIQNGRLTSVTVWEITASIHVCTACGHVFYHPVPTDEQLAQFYNGPWNAGTNFRIEDSFEQWIDKLDEYAPQRNFVDAILDIKKKYFAANERVVVHDVSCGYGALVTKLDQLGFEATGNDIDGEAIKAAKAWGNLNVHERHFRDIADLVPGGADIITCYHAVEHYANPMEFFRTIRGLLRDGGVFLMAVPNGAFLPARLDHFGKFDWCMYPGHLQYFTPHSAKVLLGMAGLRVVDTFSYPWEWPQKDWMLSTVTGLPAGDLPAPERILQALADNVLTRDLRVVAIKESNYANPRGVKARYSWRSTQ